MMRFSIMWKMGHNVNWQAPLNQPSPKVGVEDTHLFLAKKIST